MIHITTETTVQDILDDLEEDGCTVQNLLDLLEKLENDAHRLETKYPSNYPRPHLEEAIKNKRKKAIIIRQALEKY